MTSTGLGLSGCLKLGSSSSSKQFVQQRLAFRPQRRNRGILFETIRPLAANSDTTKTIQQKHIETSSTAYGGWAEFGERVSGEWDGYGADFTMGGEPIELPESVVPEAFREWEVKVFDWQTQCPTLAVDPFDFSCKLIRLLPTVGCEADAATRYSILERSTSNNIVAFAYQSSGCYVAVWPEKNGSDSVLELEHCLIDPRDSKSRMRVIQTVKLVPGDQGLNMQVEAIKVFCEQWYGPFRNGDQLGGCAIRDSAFASTPALQSSSISGLWHAVHHASATFHDSQSTSIKELVDDATSIPASVSRDGNGRVLLPKQLWCSSNHQGDGENWFEAGWLLEEGLAITSKCIFTSTADLKEIKVMREKIQT